ncbi:MAG: ammonium transporter, partial [Gammaproteobacteria bacterium]|nr:ammonium transporter [Gammaproteobacteria bacterium]
GYPSSPDTSFASINPIGQIVGAIIMFGVLGFLPGWITAKILNACNLLRIPRQVELMGLDTAARAEITEDERAIIEAEREAITGR